MKPMQIELIVGKEYLLNKEQEKTFRGFYIGKKRFETRPSPWIRIPVDQPPAGNMFVALIKDEIELWFTGDEFPYGEYMYFSEGCDGPEWPAGIRVFMWGEKFKLSKLEEEYLKEQIEIWENRHNQKK